jgi:hypothetical protein
MLHGQKKDFIDSDIQCYEQKWGDKIIYFEIKKSDLFDFDNNKIDSDFNISSDKVIDPIIETSSLISIPDIIRERIKEKCANDYPNDFILQVECVDSQTEAWTVLQE